MTAARDAGAATAPDDWRAKAIVERDWGRTPIGGAFARFESALGRAWCTDQRESATAASLDRDWEAATRARAELRDAIRALEAQRDELSAALRWALPLAELAVEDHRQVRLRAGHKFGTKRIGLYDSEVAEIEAARAALAKVSP